MKGFAHLRGLMPFPDRDGDQIPDDGDLSGVAGDNPCVDGDTMGCDDNCGGIPNASQDDHGGAGGPDGQGDVCQCGDPTGDAFVTAADLLEMRQQRLGLLSSLTVPERCSVHSDGLCSLVDLVVLDRALANPSDAPGVGIQSVRSGSPAEGAGLRAGDRIVSFDGAPVANLEEYAALLFSSRPGSEIEIVVIRDGERVTARAALGRRR